MVQNSTLTSDWNWKKVSEIADTKSGGTPLRSHPEYFNGDIPWIKSGELGDGYIRSAEESITYLGMKNSSARIFPKGSVLVALYGATAGKVGILNIDAATNQAVCALFPKNDSFIPKYMFYWIISQRDNLLKQRIGGAQPNISQSIIRSQNFPLAPIHIQKSIVEKIEELFSQLDAGVAGLKRAQAELQRYRASVLKAAFEGRLVPQDPNDEPAISILKKLEKEPLGREDLPTLPDGWVWTKVGDISILNYGKGLPKHARDKNGEYPVYGSNGVTGYHSKFLVNKPCLIIGRKGAAGLVHISTKPCWVIDTAYFLIPPKDIDLKFLFYLFSSLELNKFDSSTAIPSLRRGDAYSQKIPLPPLNEQKRIVNYIEISFSLIANVDKMITKNQNQTDNIRQSILKMAFSGKLLKKNKNGFHK